MPVIADGERDAAPVLTNRRGVAHFAVTPSGTGVVHFRRARLPQSAGTRCRTLLGSSAPQDVGHRLSRLRQEVDRRPERRQPLERPRDRSDTRTQPCETA